MDKLPLELLIYVLELCSLSVERVCKGWYLASRQRTQLERQRLSITILHRYSRLTSFDGQILCYQTDDVASLRQNTFHLVGDVLSFTRLISLRPKALIKYTWDFFQQSKVVFDYKDGRITINGSHSQAPYHLLNTAKDAIIDLTLDGYIRYSYLPRRVGNLTIDLGVGQRVGYHPIIDQFKTIIASSIVVRSERSLGWMKPLIQMLFSNTIQWIEQ